MFLPNVGGLTDRKLHTASSLPLFFLLSLYGHVNLLLHVRMGTLIFLRGLSILLLGKSCQCPHTKVTLTYILASGCIGFPIVNWVFLWLESVSATTLWDPYGTDRGSNSISIPQHWARAGALQTHFAWYEAVFSFIPFPFKKKNPPFNGSHFPCQEFVLCDELAHRLPDCKWLISYLWLHKFGKVTWKLGPLTKIYDFLHPCPCGPIHT